MSRMANGDPEILDLSWFALATWCNLAFPKPFGRSVEVKNPYGAPPQGQVLMYPGSGGHWQDLQILTGHNAMTYETHYANHSQCKDLCFVPGIAIQMVQSKENLLNFRHQALIRDTLACTVDIMILMDRCPKDYAKSWRHPFGIGCLQLHVCWWHVPFSCMVYCILYVE